MQYACAVRSVQCSVCSVQCDNNLAQNDIDRDICFAKHVLDVNNVYTQRFHISLLNVQLRL